MGVWEIGNDRGMRVRNVKECVDLRGMIGWDLNEREVMLGVEG